jgi:hypothetical protein
MDLRLARLFRDDCRHRNCSFKRLQLNGRRSEANVLKPSVTQGDRVRCGGSMIVLAAMLGRRTLFSDLSH